MTFQNGLKFILGATYMDVSKTENNIRTRQILTEKFSGTWAISYRLPKLFLDIDYTGNIYGPMRLPLLGELDPRQEYSPTWSIQNIQFTFNKIKNIEIYMGIKNLLNWTPNKGNPFLIARAEDPFDQNVDYDAVTSAFQFGVNNWSYELIPFQDIAEEWNSIQDLQFDEDDLPEQEIDFEKINTNNYANPKWIPFATGRNGDYLLYDTDPASKGKFGQIIELQNESWDRNIVADSLEELIQNEISNLRAGKTEHFDFIIGKENS